MRFILRARLRVTPIGKPSGTETTIRVTAIMKIFSIWEIRSMTGIPDEPSNNLISKAIKVKPGNRIPSFTDYGGKSFQLYLSGVSMSLSICEPSYTLPYPVASPHQFDFHDSMPVDNSCSPHDHIGRIGRFRIEFGFVGCFTDNWFPGQCRFVDLQRYSFQQNDRRQESPLRFPVRRCRRQRLLLVTWQIFPSRITLTSVSSLTVFSTSNALLAFSSKKKSRHRMPA